MTDYGDRIKSERQRLGLTQQAFSDAVGVSQGSQVGYESGARIPNVHYLAKAAEAGVDPIYILMGKPTAATALDEIDWDTHDLILEWVDNWLKNREITISIQKKMHLVRMFFSKFSTESSIDTEYIETTLALVA